MNTDMMKLAEYFYNQGRGEAMAKMSSFAGLGSARAAASRLAPLGLSNFTTGALYRVPAYAAGELIGNLAGEGYWGGHAGDMVAKLFKDYKTRELAGKLTRSEARKVLDAIPDYGFQMFGSTAAPLGYSILHGNMPDGVSAISNLTTDRIVRRKLMERAGLLK